MPLKEILAERLPFLRRYARALCGSQMSGDSYVRELLEAATADMALRKELAGGRVQLYRAFTQLWASAYVAGADTVDEGDGSPLRRVSPESRQALLLTSVEEFSIEETAQILDLTDAEVTSMLAEAIAEIEGQDGVDVLIIEDEPLIAMQLEALIEDLGHTVVAMATTRSEAVEAYQRTRPGLVLADIQLADQSSGIDAIEEILAMGPVPVIFITAYPERLLTGERPEPTYLVTKPFREDTVRTAISQALFFS